MKCVNKLADEILEDIPLIPDPNEEKNDRAMILDYFQNSTSEERQVRMVAALAGFGIKIRKDLNQCWGFIYGRESSAMPPEHIAALVSGRRYIKVRFPYFAQRGPNKLLERCLLSGHYQYCLTWRCALNYAIETIEEEFGQESYD